MTLTGQLDRKTYQNVNAVPEELGGKWSRKEHAHVFSGDPAAKLAAILDAGKFIQKEQEYGAFFTPQELAASVIGKAELQPGMKVLEPSAGHGALAIPAAEIVGIENVECVELQAANAAVLRDKGLKVTEADFLTVPPDPSYDRIVMNPPFAKQADIEHVSHALKFLKPGGRLVAIMAAGVQFRQNKKTTEFISLLGSDGKAFGFEENPQGAFKGSGTGVNTVTLTVWA